MGRTERKVIADIILIEPFIIGLQNKIDKEQSIVIEDMISPAKKTAERLIALDNRRIDLCNLKVLYAQIERGLGAEFTVLKACAYAGADSALYRRAAAEISALGYDTERADNEFGYLFKNLKSRRKKVKCVVAAAGDYQSRSLGRLNR